MEQVSCNDDVVHEDALWRSRPSFRRENLDPTWVQQLEQVDPIDLDQCFNDGSARWLEWLGLATDDQRLVEHTFPDREGDPDRWWVLERIGATLADGMPGADPAVPLPKLEHLGVLGTLFPLHALATVVPHVVRFHQSRGVPREVTLATLDVRNALKRDEDGLPLLDTSGWFLWRFRGLLYQVGALRVIPVRLGDAPDSEAYYQSAEIHPRAPGHRRGDPALSIHIPEGTPFSARHVRSSVESMSSAFATWFAPDHAPRIGTCGSWLLDPQLREHLPPHSNIVEFQRTFINFDAGRESDSIMQFVFPGQSEVPIEKLPTETTLQRAVVTHLKPGGRWRVCGGWTALPT